MRKLVTEMKFKPGDEIPEEFFTYILLRFGPVPKGIRRDHTLRPIWIGRPAKNFAYTLALFMRNNHVKAWCKGGQSRVTDYTFEMRGCWLRNRFLDWYLTRTADVP